jgi:prevent-host-death family protein
MNTVTYSKFNENSKRYLDEIVKTHGDIVIIKNGKPFFRILPIINRTKNPLKNSILYEEDIISPIAEDWKSE